MKQLNFDEFVKMLAGKLSNKEIVDKNLSYQPNLKINLKRFFLMKNKIPYFSPKIHLFFFHYQTKKTNPEVRLFLK